MMVAGGACAGMLCVSQKATNPVHLASILQADTATHTLAAARGDDLEETAAPRAFDYRPSGHWVRRPVGRADARSSDRAAATTSASMPPMPLASSSYWMSGPEFLTDPAAATAHTLAVGDVSRDGRDDLVFFSLRGAMAVEDYITEIYVAYQRDDGRLDTAIKIGDSGNSFSSQLKIADLDRDGFNEIVTTTVDGVMILRSKADGTFASTTTPAGDPHAILITDVDRDGYPDVLVDSADLSATVVHGDSRGAFNRVSILPLLTSGARTTGDVTGDGLDDLILANVLNGLMEEFRIYPALSSGGYGTPTVLSLPLGSNPAVSMVVGDFNGDGRGDLVLNELGNDKKLRLYTQNYQGELATPVMIDRYSAAGPMIATDLDRDGRTDLATAHTGWSYVGYYLQGSAGLMPEIPINAYQSQGRNNYFATGDLNHDGCGDMAVARSSQSPVLLYGKGCTPRPRFVACCSRPIAVEHSVAGLAAASPPARPQDRGMTATPGGGHDARGARGGPRTVLPGLNNRAYNPARVLTPAR